MNSPAATRMPSRRERRRAVTQAIAARRHLETEPRPRGRVWINGREVDGPSRAWTISAAPTTDEGPRRSGGLPG